MPLKQTAQAHAREPGEPPVLVVRGEGMIHLILNRPRKINALTLGMPPELIAALRQAEADAAVRVAVVSGAGRGSCSGWDRGPDDAAAGPADGLAIDAPERELMHLLAGMTTLTVGQLHGASVGGAALLAAGCDFRIASQDAFFWLPEVSFGSPLLWTGLAPLVREIGHSHTRYLALSNQRVDTQWALSAGLIHEVVPADRLRERVRDFASETATIPSRAVSLMKQDLNRVAASLPQEHGHTALTVYESLTADTFQGS